MKGMKLSAFLLVIVAMIFGGFHGVTTVLAEDPPPITPSSFYGEIHFLNGPPYPGDSVNAYVGNSTTPRATATIQGSDPLFYAMDVLGSASDEGLDVTFEIDGRIVAVGKWHSGTNVNLDLHPPAANAHSPYVAVVNEPVTLSGSATDWLTSDSFSYVWDFDEDGEYDDSSIQNPSYTSPGPGVKTIKLRVADSQGGVGTASASVFVVTITGLTGQTYTGTAKAVTVDWAPYGYVVTYDSNPNPPINAGSYTVAVKIWADSGQSTPAGTITKTMVIGKKPASVTPNAESKIFGAGDPNFTGALDGFVAVDGIYAAYAREPGEDAGTYVVSATLNPLEKLDNYDITYNTSLFTINPKWITVTPDSGQSKVFGADDPVLTYTSSETVSFTGALSRNPGSDVGSYPITLGSLSAGSNYSINLASTDFTITPLPVTVTVTPGQSKVYGDDDPSFAYSTSTVSPAPTFEGALARVAGENVGPYAINQGTLSAGSNYSISFVGADFTITAKQITVTANPGQSKPAGAADPVFTYTSSDPGVSFIGALSRVAGETIGTYAITLGTLSAGPNYIITFDPADFTIVGIQHSISLVVGWNLVSFNVHPTSTAIEDVLADIAGKYSLVYAWDATGAQSSAGNWKKYDPAQGFGQSLDTLDETMGFWIKMTAEDTLDVVGTIPTSVEITLLNDVGGWNLVGFPSAASLTLDNSHVPTNSSLLFAYHVADTSDPWKLYDIAAGSYANDLKSLTPGWGYWVFVSEDGTWSISN